MIIYLRLEKLRRWVRSLPVGEEYRDRLFRSIELYADQILARPDPPLANQWDDIEALQQVTLGDWNEEILGQLF